MWKRKEKSQTKITKSQQTKITKRINDATKVPEICRSSGCLTRTDRTSSALLPLYIEDNLNRRKIRHHTNTP